MLKEQEKTIQLFRQNYNSDSAEKMVIYGTGIHAEAVIKSCKDYPIIGLMDAAKTGQVLWGKRVFSEEEVLKEGISLVVVVARPAVHSIIYRRLKAWSERYGIRIQDIEGHLIANKYKQRICESPYFDISYQQLLDEIDSHNVISFDIFDTLLTRKVYEPQDVFALLDLEYKSQYPFLFSVERQRAEQELLKEGIPNITQIYQRLKENQPCLTQENCEELLSREIQKEYQVLMPRRKMLECMQYCVDKGKRIVLVSDMYLSESYMRKLLSRFNIIQYEKLFVSCDYGLAKNSGLFRIVKDYLREESCLHIGDNVDADGISANKEGFDSFLIMSSIHMMELSTYSFLLTALDKIENRVMLGLLVSEVFNNPFILHNSAGKPSIVDGTSFGYVFIAPLIVSFVIWMIEKVRKEKNAVVLFSSRDGWLIQKIYNLLQKKFSLSYLPKDYYLLISRKAMLNLSKGKYEKDVYLKYLEDFGLEKYSKIFFFDFMSRGTCQYYFEQLIQRTCYGLYFQKSNSEDARKEQLIVDSYYKEKNAQNTNQKIFALCDFLECILTSYEPSFLGFYINGMAVYEKERRTKKQMDCLRMIHKGIQKYTMEFIDILRAIPEHMSTIDYCDELMGFMGAAYSKVEVSGLNEFILDDIMYGDKNTGKDALI